MDDGEWRGNGPGVYEFAVAADGGVGKDTVGACFKPGFDIGAKFVPIESEADAMESFVLHEMAGGRRGVEGFKDAAAEGFWRNNEE